MSPRPVLTISLKDCWQKGWNSDAASSSSSTQPIQPISRYGNGFLGYFTLSMKARSRQTAPQHCGHSYGSMAKTATCPTFNSNHQLPSSDDAVVSIQSPKILIEHTHTNFSFRDDHWLAQLRRCRHTAEAVMERTLQKGAGGWLEQLEFGLELTESAHQFNL